MSNSNKKYMRVPNDPDNPFNNPWNIGLLGGTVTGLIGGYVFYGKIFPFVKKMLTAAFIGHTKLALVVNADLKMSKGKIASQCSHASIAVYKKLNSPLRSYSDGLGLLAAWELVGQPKVVLRAQNVTVMKELQKAAAAKGILTSIVLDAGRTEVAPGSLTVLALGPAPILMLEGLTGHLRLL